MNFTDVIAPMVERKRLAASDIAYVEVSDVGHVPVSPEGEA
ncbi:hypothetical protein [Caulobacter sp. Root655]|nr:hypothetical protein [Caulobacter sp. Root655]